MVADKLIEIVDHFVKSKNGTWNHTEWLSLVNDVKHANISITIEKLGDLLVERNKFYSNELKSNDVVKESKIRTLARLFIKKHNGIYDHKLWLQFLKELEKFGSYDNSVVGNILEDEKNNFNQHNKKIDEVVKIETDKYKKKIL